MAVDEKVLKRVEKLLRLASPSSGTTEAERFSAFQEASRLFVENDLVVREREPAPSRRQRAPERPRQPEPQYSPFYSAYSPPPQYHQYQGPTYPPTSQWEQTVATEDAICADPTCGRLIQQGTTVYARVKHGDIEYLHRDGPCDW